MQTVHTLKAGEGFLPFVLDALPRWCALRRLHLSGAGLTSLPEALLAGRYLKSTSPVQLIRPSEEFDALMNTLFQVQTLALAVMALTLGAALAIAALVFALSFRLRRREFATLGDVGVSPFALTLTKLFEVVIVGAGGVIIAASLTLMVQINAPSWVRWLLA
jgi:putative ABC transport system permease protein